MRLTVTQSEYLGWLAYWRVEPWGPWRDNVHAAIIAREIQRPQLKRGQAHKIPLDRFMLIDPDERQRRANQQLFTMLQALSMGGRRGN